MGDSYRPRPRDGGRSRRGREDYREAQSDSYRPEASHDNFDRDRRSNRRQDDHDTYRAQDEYYPRDPREDRDDRGYAQPRPRAGDFSFRSQPANTPDFRDTRHQDARAPRRDQRGSDRRKHVPKKNIPRGNKRFNISDRELIRGQRQPTPEQYEAMTSETKKFRDPDEVSVEMDCSEGDEPVRKKTAPNARADGSEVPKWSNPDPYTALPPPDEQSGKRTDIVSLIRKSRAIANEAHLKAGEGDDFISFGDDDDGSTASRPAAAKQREAVTFSFPQTEKFSHLDNLHPNRKASATAGPSFMDRINPSSPASSSKNGDNGKKRNKKKRARDDDSSSDDLRALREQTFVARTPKDVKDFKVDKVLILAPSWKCPKGQAPAPWFSKATVPNIDMDGRFHQEVTDFYEYVKPRMFESSVRQQLCVRLQSWVTSFMPGAAVRFFGSFASGIYLPNADMDFVVLTPQFTHKMRNQRGKQSLDSRRLKQAQSHAVRSFGNHIRRKRDMATGLTLIPHARVPLIKYTDVITQLKVDISFDNTSGLVANDTYEKWKEEYRVMPALVTLIKQFLVMRNMNDVSQGGLGGFSVTCLVISLLQHLQDWQTSSIGQLLMTFFDFYGNRFDIEHQAIQISPPAYLQKSEIAVNMKGLDNAKSLVLIDPNNSANNLTASSWDITTIFRTFAAASRVLSDRMSEVAKGATNLSMLEPLFGGDYSQYEAQRQHLLRLYG